jgi:hypothetical protein
MNSLMILISILFLATSSFASEISESEVNTFMGNWFEAQNNGTYSKYAAMYSNNFVGIRRSGSHTQKLDHDAWLKDRKRMFKNKMSVTTSGDWEIKLSGTTSLVKFEQKWESSTYTDKGVKQLNLALENGTLKIVREELLFSKVISTIDVEDSEISTVTTGTTPDGVGKYTSFKYKDCWEPKGYFAKHFDFDERSKECPGLKEWRLFYAVDLEYSWLEIGNGKRLWSTQNEVNGSGGNNFGQAQDLGSLARVEWRLKSDGTPIALIFQVQATDPNSTLYKLILLYRYYVIGLTKGVPQFCGSFKTKEEARKIADNPSRCNELQELPVTW